MTPPLCLPPASSPSRRTALDRRRPCAPPFAAGSTASFPDGLPPPRCQRRLRALLAGRHPAIAYPTSDGRVPKQQKKWLRPKPALEKEDFLHGSDPSASSSPCHCKLSIHRWRCYHGGSSPVATTSSSGRLLHPHRGRLHPLQRLLHPHVPVRILRCRLHPRGRRLHQGVAGYIFRVLCVLMKNLKYMKGRK